MRRGDRDLDTKLVGVSGLALADAFHFRRVQGIQLVPVFRLLHQNPFGPCHQVIKPLTQWTGNLLTLPVDIPPDTSYPFAKLAERISHPLELSRMRMAAHLPRQLGNHTAVALPQFQATRSGSLDQMLSGTFQKPGIRRMRNRLRHDGRVHDHRLEAGLLEHAKLLCQNQRQRQHLFHASLAQSFAPARQTGWINRWLGLQGRSRR